MYPGATLMNRMMAHRDAPIPSLAAERVECPPALEALFRRMVAKATADRQASMTEVVQSLEQLARAPLLALQMQTSATEAVQAKSGIDAAPRSAGVLATFDNATASGETIAPEGAATSIIERLSQTFQEVGARPARSQAARRSRWPAVAITVVPVVAGLAIWLFSSGKPKRPSESSGSASSPKLVSRVAEKAAEPPAEKEAIDLWSLINVERDSVGAPGWQIEENDLVFPDAITFVLGGPGSRCGGSASSRK